MQPISLDELRGLSAEALAGRIDAFFTENHIARYGTTLRYRPMVTARDVLQTKTLQAADPGRATRALMLFYRSWFEMGVCEHLAGLENRDIHARDDAAKWTEAKVQVALGTLRQSAIIASRISFESLMEFVYLIEVGNLIPSATSKFGYFRKWVSKPGNRFRWLVFYMIKIGEHDRHHRTPEVHGTSYVAVDALCCRAWPGYDSGELDATSIGINIWQSIREALDDRPVNSFFGPFDEAVAQRFFGWRELDLEALWREATGKKPRGPEG